MAEVALIALFAFLLSRLRKLSTTALPVRIPAGLLAVTGLLWFVQRLRS